MWRTESDVAENDRSRYVGVVSFAGKELMRTQESYSLPGEAMMAAENLFISKFSAILASQSGSE